MSPGLFPHLDIVLEAYKSFGGAAWFAYNESFCQKKVVHLFLHWGTKDVGLWLNLFLPQRPQFPRPAAPSNQSAHSGYRKGMCFNFNESQCRCSNTCRYKHKCTFCTGTHPISKCFKKLSSTNQKSGKEFLSKSRGFTSWPPGYWNSQTNRQPFFCFFRFFFA